MTEAEQRDIERRRSEDFKFFLLCHSKGDSAMYELLRDKELDTIMDPKQGELPLDGKAKL